MMSGFAKPSLPQSTGLEAYRLHPGHSAQRHSCHRSNKLRTRRCKPQGIRNTRKQSVSFSAEHLLIDIRRSSPQLSRWSRQLLNTTGHVECTRSTMIPTAISYVQCAYSIFVVIYFVRSGRATDPLYNRYQHTSPSDRAAVSRR